MADQQPETNNDEIQKNDTVHQDNGIFNDLDVMVDAPQYTDRDTNYK